MTWQRKLLLANGVFLVLAGTALFVLGTAGHSFGVGPLASGMRDATDTLRLAWTENFLQALLLGVALVYVARSGWDRSWAALAAAAHVVMCAGNLIFWGGFVDLNAVGPATAATIAHAIFAIGEAAAVVRPPER